MKILALLVLAVAVSARPEYGTQRLAESQELRDSLSAQDSASLPSRVWVVRQARELYGDGGAEIPVHLVYEEEAGSNRVSREPDDRRRCGGSGGRKERRSRRAIGGHHSPSSQEAIREGGGPSIVKLKVRRGGVAIAGPGGVATAGSGGTAIVGPGGTAYTTPDGTAVVGPGGRLIELSPYSTKGRSAGRLIATGPVIYYPIHY